MKITNKSPFNNKGSSNVPSNDDRVLDPSSEVKFNELSECEFSPMLIELKQGTYPVFSVISESKASLSKIYYHAIKQEPVLELLVKMGSLSESCSNLSFSESLSTSSSSVKDFS